MNLSLLLNKNKQFIKYAISGTINTCITLIVYNILIKLGVNYMVSNAIGYFLGIVNGFILNEIWVFKSHKTIYILFIKFIIVNVMSLLFSTGLLFFLVNEFDFNKIIAQLITTIVTGLINYTLNRLWTFS
ncbi:GtrA family protein [Clostridium tyrobutyricum]|uniref:GtrA family protein n=1 Tax=Clostridium tyrobutyricum TaxID=1519 RepID=UPI001C39230B|nr:GtrA family protein [Clostridium tyrobutyricum]MBV4419928.1 GtrA family protein [Clostridium tyrobutyricum]